MGKKGKKTKKAKVAAKTKPEDTGEGDPVEPAVGPNLRGCPASSGEREWQPEPDDGEALDCGVLQPLAAKVLMKILYAARMARFFNWLSVQLVIPNFCKKEKRNFSLPKIF